jgi:hypothetical protein
MGLPTKAAIAAGRSPDSRDRLATGQTVCPCAIKVGGDTTGTAGAASHVHIRFQDCWRHADGKEGAIQGWAINELAAGGFHCNLELHTRLAMVAVAHSAGEVKISSLGSIPCVCTAIRRGGKSIGVNHCATREVGSVHLHQVVRPSPSELHRVANVDGDVIGRSRYCPVHIGG